MVGITRIATLLALVAVVAATGCSQKTESGAPAPAPAPKAGDAKKDEPKDAPKEEPKKDEPAAAQGTVAEGNITLKGTVKWDGEAPAREKLKRDADPFCAKEEMLSEKSIVTDGKVQNVIVYFSNQGLPKKAAEGEVTIAQHSCMYRPRVQCATVGQKISITNDDTTMHNVHGYKGEKTWFNQAQMGGMPAIVKDMKDAGQLMTFKCDVHPWMEGYVFVSDNGYCAVSGEDGSFSIDKLPAGTWKVTAWHETYGEKTAEVTIEEGKEATLEFTYSAADKK